MAFSARFHPAAPAKRKALPGESVFSASAFIRIQPCPESCFSSSPSGLNPAQA